MCSNILSSEKRAPQPACASADTDAAATAPNSTNLKIIIVPADGTSAAAEGNGDFGRSPIFGQLSDKLLLAL